MLISAIIQNGDIGEAFKNGLDKKMFYIYPEQFAWIEGYYLAHQRTPSKSAFAVQFPDFRRKVIEDENDTTHFTQLVRQEHKRKQMELAAEKIFEMIDEDDYDNALNHMYASAIKISSDMGLINDGDVFRDNADIMKELMIRKERYELTGASGIPTGFETFDERTGGFAPGEFWVFAARPGSKKSWTLQKFASHAALCGYKVQFNALEQPRANVMARIVSLVSKQVGGVQFSAQNLIRGKDYDQMAFMKFMNDLEREIKGRLHVADGTQGKVTTSMIASQIERNKPDIVIVDHITLMGRGAQDWQGVAQVADELTQLGNQYNIPIVSAAQLNRNGTSDSAGLESIAEADKIGQNASGVVFCRPKSRRVMKFENQKQRNGDGEFGYWAEFNPDIGVFREIDYDRAQELIEQDNEEAEENE
jgi:replicative DNA helicase